MLYVAPKSSFTTAGTIHRYKNEKIHVNYMLNKMRIRPYKIMIILMILLLIIIMIIIIKNNNDINNNNNNINNNNNNVNMIYQH